MNFEDQKTVPWKLNEMIKLRVGEEVFLLTYNLPLRRQGIQIAHVPSVGAMKVEDLNKLGSALLPERRYVRRGD